MADLTDRIVEVASGPHRAKGDAGEVEGHRLKDLVEADKHVQQVAAVNTPSRGLRLTKLIPSGTI